MIVDNDLLSIQQARIIAENAFEAQKRLATFSQEQLDAIVEGMAEAVGKQAQALAIRSHEETDFGNWQDKSIKNQFVCTECREQLRGMRCVGVVREDHEKQITDIGVPVGVIVALCPVTSPVSTTIYTALIAIKSGNAVLFSPHPRAADSMGKTLDVMIEAAEAHGLPEGCLSYLSPVAKSGTLELMSHPATSLIVNTGVPRMLDAAKASGKPVIYGSNGNGPAFIERTADIQQAAQDIIRSKTFDNGIAVSAEQSVVVDSCIDHEVKLALKAQGAYFMTEEESQKLAAQLFCPSGLHRPGMVGKTAQVLAQRSGFTVPDSAKVLVAQRKYVSEADPYSRELLAPVLAYYVEDDWMHACEKCIELLLHEKKAHTLIIHSTNEDVIHQFAIKKPVGRILVNTPGAFGGMGATTNLFPSMTLGSGSAGVGITSDNVSPHNLIYTRKVGYGVHRIQQESREVLSAASPASGEQRQTSQGVNINIPELRKIITAIVEAVDGSEQQ